MNISMSFTFGRRIGSAAATLWLVGVAAASVGLFAAEWSSHPMRPQIYPELFYLLVFAQIMSAFTVPTSGGSASLKDMALTAAGLIAPGPGVILLSWLCFHDGAVPRKWAEGHRAAWSGSSGALAHGTASLVAASLIIPGPFQLALRTPVYAVVVIALETVLSAAFAALGSGRFQDALSALGDLRKTAWSRILVMLGGGLLLASLASPSGYVLAPVLIGFAAAVRRNLVDSSRLLALWDQAHHDPLTGLLNRRGMLHEVERALSGGRVRSLAVITMDIDHFKAINDIHGHPAGDRVLNLLGTVIRGHVRAGDIAARLGGEEFVVVLASVPLDRSLALAERIRRGFATSGVVGGWLSLSAGVAIGPSSTPLPELLRRADEALYEAKQAGRDRVRFRVLDLDGQLVDGDDRRGGGEIKPSPQSPTRDADLGAGR